jgi:hypothetical protein
VLLLLAAILRMWDLSTLPPGLRQDEITDARITETVRQGSIEVFYDLGDEGREGLYHAVLAVVTGAVGNGPLGYHILSTWVSLLTLALIFALVMRLFGPLAGVSALALLAVNLHYILASREIQREILLPTLVAGVLFGLARGLSVYRYANPRLPLNTIFAALGLLLGVGFYVHPAHFLIVLFTAVFVIYRLQRRQRLSEQTVSYLRFSLLVMVIVATPYLISSIRLPELSGFGRLWDGYNIGMMSPFQAYLNGLGGIFFLGDKNPVHNLPGRPLIDLFSGLILLVGLLTALRSWREPRYALPLFAALMLSPVAFLSDESPDFRRFLILLPLVGLFFGLGVSSLYRALRTPLAHRLFALGLMVLTLFNLVWLVPDFFQRWPEQPEVYTAYHGRLGQIAHYLDLTAGTMPTLICDASPVSPTANGDLRDTDMILLMMNRKNISPRFADCGTGLVLINGGEGQQIVLPASNTLESMHPYLLNWVSQGEVVTGAAMPPNAVVKLAVSDALADRIGRFTTTAPAAYDPEPPGSGGMAVPPIRFGGNITYLGYEWPTVDYTPGGILTSITYWRADGAVPPDLRLFTHVLSDPISPAAQTDTISVDMSQLQSRDVFIQITFVPLPISIPEGAYSVSIGAYTDANDVRMAVLDGGQPRGTRLFLGQIMIRQIGG